MSNPTSDLALPSSYAAYVPASGYTAADVLAKMKTVDGPGSGLDANTVSGYGVGVSSSGPVISNADTVVNTGFYRTTSTTTNLPAGTGGTAGMMFVHSWDNSYSKEIYHDFDTGFHYTRTYKGGWSSWARFWDASSDGNGGQPPSAKSNRTGNTTIGWFDSVDCASGASVTLPAGGTFEWFVTTYGATYNSVKAGISAGGAITGTASANLTMYYKRLS